MPVPPPRRWTSKPSAASSARFDFSAPRPLAQLLDWSIGVLEHGLTHLTHPRYFGLFNPAPSFPAQCADRIVAAFNPQVASSGNIPRCSGARSARDPAHRATCGLPRGRRRPLHLRRIRGELHGAHLRTDARASGVRGRRRARLPRAAGVLRVERVPPQLGQDRPPGRHRPLRRAARGDRRAAGGCRLRRSPRRSPRISAKACVPFLIVASAGTTNAGMIDPLQACADLAAAAPALVPRGCGLGRRHDCLRAAACSGRRTRARGLRHHRCPQVVRDHDGLRHVSWRATRQRWPPPSRCRRATCPRTRSRSIPT